MQLSNDEQRPLWMWPVDGLTIQIFPGWAGGATEARYIQIVGHSAIERERAPIYTALLAFVGFRTDYL